MAILTEAERIKEQEEVASAKRVLAKYVSRLVNENLEEEDLKEVDNITDEASSQLEEIDSDIIDMVKTECLVEEDDDGDAS